MCHRHYCRYNMWQEPTISPVLTNPTATEKQLRSDSVVERRWGLGIIIASIMLLSHDGCIQAVLITHMVSPTQEMSHRTCAKHGADIHPAKLPEMWVSGKSLVTASSASAVTAMVLLSPVPRDCWDMVPPQHGHYLSFGPHIHPALGQKRTVQQDTHQGLALASVSYMKFRTQDQPAITPACSTTALGNGPLHSTQISYISIPFSL